MFGVSNLLIVCGLLCGAQALRTLKQGGTLVHFAGILGTDTLVVIALALAWLLFLAAALVPVRAATQRVFAAWLRGSLKVLL